ncbi:MAG: hypothetical protein K0S28_2411 [Paucimonas sp.]|nr:hypothetical protein [Paucimonas sp.]
MKISMRQKFICLAACLFGLLAPLSHAGNVNAASSASSPRPGILYRVSHQGNTAWLYGTIHVGMESVNPLDGGIRDKLAGADALAVEVNIGGVDVQAAIARHALYSPGDTIDKHLSAKAVALLRTSLERAGIPWELAAGMKPWFVTNLLMLRELEGAGYSAIRGTEVYLLEAAKNAGKPVVEIESADGQFAMFSSMTDSQQERYLVENLEELDSGEAIAKVRELFDAWAMSDAGKMAALLNEMLKDESFTARFTQREVIGKRNPLMARKIAALMKKHKSLFVGVGALHLIGDGNVAQLLKKMGMDVQMAH